MKRFFLLALSLVLSAAGQASWYWPFESEGGFAKSGPRLSELMEPASKLIDEAADLADAGKTNEAIEKYREVIVQLDELERAYPVRAKTAEFSTLRTKRSYVNAKIDSLLLGQVKTNAKVVAVSETRDLELRLADERWSKAVGEVRAIGVPAGDATAAAVAEATNAVVAAVRKALRACGSDVQAVVSYEAGAARFCACGEFARTCRLLEAACARLERMSPLTNATDRARLRGGSREVGDALSAQSRSSRTNGVAFCRGLRAVGRSLAAVSNQTDRVAGRRARGAKESGGAAAKAPAPAARKPAPAAPRTKREQAIDDIARGDYAAAELLIREMLQAKPNGALGLNLKAALEMRRGRLDEAEAALDRAISNNGRSYFAYYNMARLMLLKNADDRNRARKYYETGRANGGPKDAELEGLLK